MDEQTKNTVEATAEAFTETAKQAASVSELAFIITVVIGLFAIVLVILTVLNWYGNRQKERSSESLIANYLEAVAGANAQHAENGIRLAACVEKLSATDEKMCEVTTSTKQSVEHLVRQNEHARSLFCGALDLAERHAPEGDLRDEIHSLKQKAEGK